MNILSKLVLVVAAFGATSSIVATNHVAAQGFRDAKGPKNNDVKVIVFGGIPGTGGQPTPSEFASHHQQVTALPIDGLVFNLTHEGGYFVDDGFSTNPRLFSFRLMAKDVQLWKSLNLGNLKHNFVRVNIGMVPDCLGNDEQWDIVLENTALAARCAKECGAQGLLLDSEMYHCYHGGIAPFQFGGHPQLTFEQYKRHVRQRGKQFMAAVNSAMPNAKLLITFATSSACRSPKNPKAPLTYNIMALMPAFVDGLMDSATEQNEIIDCFENSYGYKSRQEFARARNLIKKQAAELSADPERYSRLIRVGFGLFAHGGIGENSLGEDVPKNTHTPLQLYNVLRYASEYSDGYVWLYSLPWIKMPPDYLRAISDFRKQKALLRTPCTFYAKQMAISNSSPAASPHAGKQNWFLSGDYITLSSNPDHGGPLNDTGTVSFRPQADGAAVDGLYEVLIDVAHSNVKKHNAGSPPGDRNGSFSYRISLRPDSAGQLSFDTGSSAEFIQFQPGDADNCNPGGGGPVALSEFIAYGPDSPAGATGGIELTNVNHSDIIFELRDDVSLNYGMIAVKSITLIPAKLQKAGNL